MVAPSVLQFSGAIAITCHAAGPVIMAAGVLSLFPATSGARWVAVLIGAWLLVSTFVLPGRSSGAAAAGLIAILLAIPRVAFDARMGGGWRVLRERWRRDRR